MAAESFRAHEHAGPSRIQQTWLARRPCLPQSVAQSCYPLVGQHLSRRGRRVGRLGNSPDSSSYEFVQQGLLHTDLGSMLLEERLTIRGARHVVEKSGASEGSKRLLAHVKTRQPVGADFTQYAKHLLHRTHTVVGLSNLSKLLLTQGTHFRAAPPSLQRCNIVDLMF